jgi:hypothetical protein
MLQACV